MSANLLAAAKHAGRTAGRSLRVETLEDRCLLSADAASSAINGFGQDIYQYLQQQEGNLVVSPLSLSMGLTMAYLGAAGQTAAEMASVLNLPSDSELFPSYQALHQSFTASSQTAPDYRLQAFNVFWRDDSMTVKTGYSDALADYFAGVVATTDFADPEAAEEIINFSIELQTDGQIEELVYDLSPATRAVITNAVRMNASWDYGMEPDGVQTFTLADGSLIQTPTMYGQPRDASRTAIEGFDVLELPLAGGAASAFLVMPLAPGDPNVLTPDFFAGFDAWLAGPREFGFQEVIMPDMSIVVENRFDQFLQDLGMPTAFSPTADFSGITDEPIFVEKVFHNAAIDFSVEGIRASAATGVELFLCFAQGTRVLTPDGAKAIEDIKIGDLVLARHEHEAEGDVIAKNVEAVKTGEAEIYELRVGALTIRTTDLHPFFVEGAGWTPAKELQPGDRLSIRAGGYVGVADVRRTGETETVHNLRVADFRTFFVTDEQNEFALWTHNYYGGEFVALRPFHFLVRDNSTGALSFMGRVNDPTNAESTVTPVAAAALDPGNYDGVGGVDEGDFQVWLNSYGATGVGLPADGNGDGRVDGLDYAVWRENVTPVPTPSATPSAPADEALAEAPATPALDEADDVYWAPYVFADSPGAESSERSAALATPVAAGDLDDTLLLLAADRASGQAAGPAAPINPLGQSNSETEPESDSVDAELAAALIAQF